MKSFVADWRHGEQAVSVEQSNKRPQKGERPNRRRASSSPIGSPSCTHAKRIRTTAHQIDEQVRAKESSPSSKETTTPKDIGFLTSRTTSSTPTETHPQRDGQRGAHTSYQQTSASSSTATAKQEAKKATSSNLFSVHKLDHGHKVESKRATTSCPQISRNVISSEDLANQDFASKYV